MRIHPESELRLSKRFNWDWRAMWIGTVLITCSTIAIVTTMFGVFDVGLLVIGVIVVLSLVLLTKFPGGNMAIITWIFRRAKADLGENVYTSNDHKSTEALENKGNRYPKRLGKVEFHAYKASSGHLGVAHDRKYGTLSFTMRVTCSSLLVSDEIDRLVRLEAFAHLLDRWSEPLNPVCRFSWSVQTLLGKASDPVSFVRRVREEAGFHANPQLDVSTLYREMEKLALSSWEDVISFTVTIDPDAVSADRLKKMGGIEAMVLFEAAEMARALQVTSRTNPLGLTSAYFLNYNGLLLHNRLALDPVWAHPYLQLLGNFDEGFVFSSQRPAWPGYFDFSSADSVRAGSTFHIGHYLAETPAKGVLDEQLKGILNLRAPKTVTAVYHMLPFGQAQRRAQSVSNAASAVLRERENEGARLSRAELRQAEAVEEHEDQIAGSFGADGRLRLYATSYGSSLDEARESALLLVGAGQDSSLKLEPLVGRHVDALEVLLPVGRGLVTLPLRR